MCTDLKTGLCSKYLRDRKRTSRLEYREEESVVMKKAREVSKGQSSKSRAEVWILCCWLCGELTIGK